MTTAVVPDFTLGDRITKAREVTGMTQAQFAQACGFVLKTYQRWERDELEPPKATQIGIAVTSGVSVSWLLTGVADTETDTAGYASQGILAFEYDLVA